MKSKTDRVLPQRKKLLMESEDPRFVVSITDNEKTDPRRFKPTTDKVEPSLA